MKKRIRNKVHRRFEKDYQIKRDSFRSDRKRNRGAILDDLLRQMDTAYDYWMSRFCK
jgi:hypothetical protein